MITSFCVCWGEQIDDKVVIIRNVPERFVQRCDGSSSDLMAVKPIRMKCDLNSYFVCLFITTLKNSDMYRQSVTKALFKRFNLSPSSVLRIRIRMYSGKHIIDYTWNDIIIRLCNEKRELDSAMAWLSTLGGAFSALGDYFQNYALMASRISAQQFKLALRIGDPQTVARCRLFYALSLIQRGRLKHARNLVKAIYEMATTRYVADVRLRRMCHGIWTKLRYEWSRKYKRKSA